MKISLNWIKDFVSIDPGISSQELLETITLSVCEVEGYEETGHHLEKILAAEVIDIQPHPDADKLSLVTVNHGSDRQRVVCGASNFTIGDIVPFAGEGITLPDGLAIRKTTIRGVESGGMLCAADELGFTEDHSGLLLLPDDTVIGTTLDKLYEDQIDVILEIDNKSITHRPDLWGHYGFARELGAIYRVPVKPLSLDINSISGSGERIIEVEVQAGELVPRFSGLSIDNIRIGPSPLWVQHRLTRVGLRPINNMVDLTNYVMLELGQPMHAFDTDQIAGTKLIVKQASPGTKIMTLYQKEVELGKDDMTICDENGASVVAGVIGGLHTGVNDKSTSIFLEAANWDPVGIRKTSTRIGLRTDACQRFEKALDPELSMPALQRAVEMMRMTNPNLNIRGNPVDIRNKAIPPITIKITTDMICKRLGKQIEDNEIKDIFKHLGFTVTEKDGMLLVGVPSYRRTKDVSIPEDLIEEIGRIHGFNNIIPIAPQFPIGKPTFNLQHKFENLAKAVLNTNRYHEVVNYALTCQKTEDVFKIRTEGIMKLMNPVADHQDQMRTSMLPHFSKTILDNQKTSFTFKIFEAGRIYHKSESGEILEPSVLIMAVSSKKRTPGDAFYLLKNDITNLLSQLHIANPTWIPLPDSRRSKYQHTLISAEIKSNDEYLGTIYSMTPEYMDILGYKEDVCIAELDFSKMYNIGKKDYSYKTPPKYPSLNFEVSVLVPDRVFFREISQIIQTVDSLVEKVDYLGVYYPENHPGMKSVSISIEFRSAAKTLNPDESKDLQDAVVKTLSDAGYNLRDI